MKEFQKQSYKADGFRIIFSESESAALYAYKDGEDYYLALNIRVMKTHEDGKERLYGSYFRNFEKQPNISHITKFIDKFLADKEYREQYHVDGEHWAGCIAPKKDEKSLVNPRCAAAIKRISSRSMNKLKFKDFAALKTYGMDGFSRMKEDKLKECIGPEAFSTIDAALDNDLKLSAYRCVARGLKPDYAIRKVKTDAEIAANAHGW